MALGTETEHYDLITLGSGEAGKYIGWTLARQGKRCAVIERKWLGGSCPNVACLPSKNIIHSAKIATLSAHAKIHHHDSITRNGGSGNAVDMGAVKLRKDA